jgi:hypothetical protein
MSLVYLIHFNGEPITDSKGQPKCYANDHNARIALSQFCPRPKESMIRYNGQEWYDKEMAKYQERLKEFKIVAYAPYYKNEGED